LGRKVGHGSIKVGVLVGKVMVGVLQLGASGLTGGELG
jgi:hypothetical protein